MEYPLIDRQLLSNLRLVHGFYNTAVMLCFLYQGRLGLSIRRARMAKTPLPFHAIRRHRRLGPILTVLGGVGFLIGLTLVLLSTGNVFEHPPHLIVGLLIISLLIATFIVSRGIKSPDSPYRTPHFYIGIAILGLYVVQVFLGIGVLL
ncbi:MAG TPA: DUF4079 family protein [Nitrospirota bacterium]